VLDRSPSRFDEPVAFDGNVYEHIRLGSLRFDTYPPFEIYFRPGADQPFVLYCERNTAFTEESRKRLEDNNVSHLYVQHEQRDDYNQYLADNLPEILADESLTAEEKTSILYDSAQSVVQDVLESPQTTENVQRGKEVIHYTVDFVRSEGFLLDHFLRTISCDYYLYTHSVNVSAYSVVLGMHSGFQDRASLCELANGGLFHDVGRGQLSEELQRKKEVLSNEEWEMVREHPVEGHKILSELGNLGEIALDIALHHHERMDGSGYPDALTADQISPFVRISAIADVFDALTSDRFHQDSMATFDALMFMKTELTKELDPQLLDTFIQIMSGQPQKN
jgi:HD-GYP domain-containing protein (c-di-GMP phosphodiesterase class II)